MDRRFKLGHIDLAALDFCSENASDEVTIALHGWLDNANSYLPMMEYNQAHRVIAIDWPGHGLSAHRTHDASYHLLDYVHDLYALIQKNQWPQINIIGHSLGAIVASIFAGTFPELVNKLVLIEALGPITAKPQDTTELLRKSIINKYQSQIKLPSNKQYSSTEKAVLARTMASDFDSDIARLLVERAIKKDGEGFVWRSDSRLKQLSPMRMVEEQAEDILANIKHDTLLILGESGYQSMRDALEARKSYLADLKHHTLAGGHHLHMENPQAVWQLIEQHLAR
ncbi:MAG: alpha/beta fold hydrolase [Psychrobium sp.]